MVIYVTLAVVNAKFWNVPFSPSSQKIIYPVIAEPPLYGAIHWNLIEVDEALIKVGAMGALGTFAAITVRAGVDCALSPIVLIAVTLN